MEVYFKQFYNYLTNLFESNTFFANPPKAISEYFVKADNFLFATNDRFIIHLKYFIIGYIKRTDRTIAGLISSRKTSEWYGVTDEYDERKTKQALPANVVHAFDAYIVRAVFEHTGITMITIHDCYGPHLLDIKKFKKASNEVMQKIYNGDLFCLNRGGHGPLVISGRYIFL